MNDLKQKRIYLRDQNKLYGAMLAEVPRNRFPAIADVWPDKAPTRMWRSRDFVVQYYAERAPNIPPRLSVNRTELNSDGGWKEGITWDELQRLKREAGFGDVQAIEFYPPDDDLVHDANIRHLWLMIGGFALPFAWTKENRASP